MAIETSGTSGDRVIINSDMSGADSDVYTISGWFLAPSKGDNDYETLVGLGDGAGGFQMLYFHDVGTTNRFIWYADIGGSGGRAVGSIVPAANKWYFFCLRADYGLASDEGRVTIFDPGGPTWANDVDRCYGISSSDRFQLGGNSEWSGEELNAYYSAIKIWDAFLSLEEVYAEAMFYLPVTNLDKVLCVAPFIADTEANAYKDISGNGNDWSEVSGGGSLNNSWGPPIAWAHSPTFYSIPAAAAATERSIAGSLPAMAGALSRKFQPKRTIEGVI